MKRALANLLAGRTLVGRYRIGAAIGSGGMGMVFRAEDLRLHREVALKVLSIPEAAGGETEEHRERLRREAASAARIPPHPNVVQVYDYATDPVVGIDFLVMELLEGRELKTRLAEGPMPAAEALRVLLEATRGVAAGHRSGIIHRDVKPSNILLTGRDVLERVKILDFGIAKALDVEPADDLTRTGMIPLSPAYAPPERFRATAPLTAASDVYQLGLVGYELLAGERPFTEEERAALQAGGDPGVPCRGRWGEVAPELRAAVERALRVRPEDRYADAAAFAEALAPDRADSTRILTAPAEALPVPEPARPAASPRAAWWRRPLDRKAWAAIALGAAAVVALLFGPARRPRPAPPLPARGTAATAFDAAFRPLMARATAGLERAESEPAAAGGGGSAPR